jgi:tRNA threonylcarbamoyl adenosine modification protein YeaZ
MKALIIDTSTKYLALGSASWGTKGEPEVRMNPQPVKCDYATSGIGANLDNFLASTGSRLEDFDAIVIGKGPGSFTGIKIGIAFAQGLARGSHKKKLNLIGFSGLESLAQLSDTSGAWVLKATQSEGYVAVRNAAGVEMLLLQLGNEPEFKTIAGRQSVDTVLFRDLPIQLVDNWPEFEEKAGALVRRKSVLTDAELCEALVKALANQLYRHRDSLAEHKLEPFYARFSAPQEKLLGNQR